MKSNPFGLGGAALAVLCLVATVCKADVVVRVDPGDRRGTWEGWGTSLCWWGHAVGGTRYERLFADLVFTPKPVNVLGRRVPGLGLSIARYNAGGGGSSDAGEQISPRYLWHKDIDGFWVDGANADPASSSWDWTRDAGQRAMMRAAHRRGATLEFFSNAPMWWMTKERSSWGGELLPEHRRDFARYLAVVARYSATHWGVTPATVEPFNEPAAGWWRFPQRQEGCNMDRDVQAQVIGYLREELDSRGLHKVGIAASDENSMSAAIATYGALHGAADLVDQVNVHSYSGLGAWRDNGVREALRKAVGGKRLWASEFGDPEEGGMVLAQTIVEDLNFLRPSAWVYWQVVEASTGWGLLNAKFGSPEDRHAPDRAAPLRVNAKYYVFAQFTRFLRPGTTLLGSDAPLTVVGYDAKKRVLTLITVNLGEKQTVTYDLSALKKVGTRAWRTTSTASGTKQLSQSRANAVGGRITFDAEPNSVHSTVIGGVELP